MSKKWKIAVIAIVVVALLSLCACQNGGLSAYEIAVNNGFEGTEAEWLESLKGVDGVDGADGVDGKDGLNGADGQSITIADLQRLYEQEVQDSGYAGTFYEFLQDKLGLTIDVSIDDSEVIEQCLLSAVSIKAYNSSSTSGSAGSGIIYKLNKETGSAIIVTNYHVVYDGSVDDGVYDTIKAYLYGGECEAQAISTTYVGGSMNYDLAVLKVENSDVLKDSYAKQVTVSAGGYQVGERAIAIGNPQAEGLSATAGIVSVESEYISISAVDNSGTINMRVMRIDTAINSGNSGGGLFNAYGQLIGIVNAKYNSTTIDNVGYAIPIEVVKNVVDNVIDSSDGKVRKLVFGFEATAQDSVLAYDAITDKYYIKETCSVSKITTGGLADGVLQVGDVVQTISINGVEKSVNRIYDVSDLMLTVRVGDQVKLTVLRGETPVYLEVDVSSQEVLTVIK
ncbi:MAG: S1C family serine protease [Christensenellales bacterium]